MNQAAARDCFGNENPIGKQLTLNHITLTKGEITYEIVGVVENAKYNDLQQPAPPTIYRYSLSKNLLVLNLRFAPGLHRMRLLAQSAKMNPHC